MKIDLKSDDSTSSGVVVQETGIDLSKKAKLFSILSNGLYKNKILSMIRELASNAYDAHKMNGNLDVAFNITIPTWENPFFIIRDFGVGLTATEAETTMFSYLGSAKDNSDEFIGGWGLGSKSPYACSKEFEVVLYKDGYFWQYNCWQDGFGIPQHGVFEEGTTSEPNGILVKVPVDSMENYKYRDALITYLSDTNFNIVITNPSALSFTKKTIKFQFEQSGYKFAISDHSSSGEVMVLYGGFIYRISELDGLENETVRILNELKTLINYSVLLDVQVGQCDFSVSRESLAGSHKTLTFVNGALEAFMEYAGSEALDYHTNVISQVNTVITDAKLKKTPIDFKLIQETQQKYNTVKPIFSYLQYGNFLRKLAPPDVKIKIKGIVEGENFDLFSLTVTLNSFTMPLSNRKTFNTSKGFRRVKVGSSYKNYEIKYKSTVSLGAIDNIKVNVLAPISTQYKFTWCNERVFGKYLNAHSGHAAPVFVVECPTQQEAEKIYFDLGLGGIEIKPISEYFEVLTKDSPARKKMTRPVKIKDFIDNTEHEYNEDDYFVYHLPEDLTKVYSARSHLSGWFNEQGHTLFCASPNFLKKYKNLENVIYYKDAVEELGITFSNDMEMYRSRKLAAFFDGKFSKNPICKTLLDTFLDKSRKIKALTILEWLNVDLVEAAGAAKTASHDNNSMIQRLETVFSTYDVECSFDGSKLPGWQADINIINQLYDTSGLQYLDWNTIINKPMEDVIKLKPLVVSSANLRV